MLNPSLENSPLSLGLKSRWLSLGLCNTQQTDHGPHNTTNVLFHNREFIFLEMKSPGFNDHPASDGGGGGIQLQYLRTVSCSPAASLSRGILQLCHCATDKTRYTSEINTVMFHAQQPDSSRSPAVLLLCACCREK